MASIETSRLIRPMSFLQFFTETSGCKVPCRVDSLEEYTNSKLNLGNGVLIAVPIPKEHSASGSLIESAIQHALTEAMLKLLYAHLTSGVLSFLGERT
ncbi:hypothetical protein PTKIN_Ptkin11bG0091500 [Pterospermum kingtungense]